MSGPVDPVANEGSGGPVGQPQPGDREGGLDLEALIRAIEHDDVARARIRSLLLTEELLGLPEVVARLATHVGELTRQVKGLVEQVTKLFAIMERFDARLGKIESDMEVLKSDVAVLKSDVAVLKSDVAGLKVDVGDLKGTDLERRVRDHPKRYLGAILRSARLFDVDDAPRADHLDVAELVDLMRADAVFEALDRSGTRIFVLVEAAWTAHSHDVGRAATRSRLLARATAAPVLPIVLTTASPAEPVLAQAVEEGVAVFTTGAPEPLVPGALVAA